MPLIKIPQMMGLCVCVCSLMQPVNSKNIEIPAFPGAQGAGAATVGGRGGRILIVDRLDDPCPDDTCSREALNDPARLTPGTLRWALKQPYPRIIVFRVSGVIRLQPDTIRKQGNDYHTLPRAIVIDNPFITIAGQSAPQGGITIANNGISIETHDVVIRYIRLRTGRSIYTQLHNQQNPETLTLGLQARRVVIDHCSINWMPAEGLSVYTGQRWDGKQGIASAISLSWNLIGEGLIQDKAGYGHPSGGFMVGFDGTDDTLAPDNISFHHNLLVHTQKRNGLLQGRRIQFINNLIYNWQWLPTVLVGAVQADLIGNHWKPGPLTSKNPHAQTPLHWVPDARTLKVKSVDGWWHGTQGLPSLYLKNNSLSHQAGASIKPEKQQKHRLLCTYTQRHAPCKNQWPDSWRRVRPQTLPFPIQVTPLNQLEERVLTHVGRSKRLTAMGRWRADRDAVDQRYIQEYQQGSYARQRFPWHEKQVGGYPVVKSIHHPKNYDRDNDGMADQWEVAHQLDPHTDDSMQDRNADGYTHIEAFLNGLQP